MKRIRSFVAVAIVGIALVCGLSACGGGAGGSDADADKTAESYEVETFDLGKYLSYEIYNDEVVFAKDGACDAFLVYAKISNVGDEPWSESKTANVHAHQDGESLDWFELHEKSQLKLGSIELEPGDSIELVYSWKLNDYSPVAVNFGGYTVSVEGTDITFDIADRQTDESKAAQAAAADEKASKLTTKELAMEGCTVTLADGWYVGSSSASSAKLKNDSLGSGAYMDISCRTNTSPAQEAIESLNKNFGGGNAIDTVTIGSAVYYRIIPADSQFYLVADTSTAGSTVKLSGMFLTMDQAASQLEKIIIK